MVFACVVWELCACCVMVRLICVWFGLVVWCCGLGVCVCVYLVVIACGTLECRVL